MKSKATTLWFMVAVTLAAAIWLLNTYLKPHQPVENFLFAGLRPDRVTSLQITPGGWREISVVRSNQNWQIEQPITYPAQEAAIDGLLDALQKLTPAMSFAAGEMASHKNADSEFGFDNPQYTLDISQGEQAWHLRVGNKTAPGDGVYVRFLGTTGAYVTDTSWLQFLPHEVNDWRDTTLVDIPNSANHLIITNGSQAIELQCDDTNRLWRMIRPISARANNQRIAMALQQLRTATVSKFVSDDPKADLSTNGLEPATLDIWLGDSSNMLAAVHVGKDVPGAPGEVFARRDDLNSVVTTAKTPLAAWQGSPNDFRDPNLLELTAPVAEIEVRGQYNFTLQSRGSNAWTEAGEKFPIESDLVRGLIQTLGQLRIANFVQDFVTPAGLQNYGLAPKPSREVTLRAAVGDTNREIVHLLFGATNTNGQTYVKRGDEPFVYAVPSGGLAYLQLPGDFYRDHHIWNFSETNVAQVTVQQNGKTRQMIRTGTNEWSLASGSQGIINPPAIEETVHQLGDLAAFEWYSRQPKDSNEMGVTTNSLNITVELKSGEKYAVAFGNRVSLQDATTAMATVTLDGECWGFIFPPALCLLIAENLTIQ
jgi:hypothetical protein